MQNASIIYKGGPQHPEPQHAEWASIQLLTLLLLTFLFTLPKCQVIFNKKKQKKSLEIHLMHEGTFA